MKQLFLILLIGLFISPAFSQQDCEVMIPALQGKYKGDCKNKKADGSGRAEGADSYEGNFKNGYPSANGTYTYKNGDYYKGNFSKGMKDGQGEFHYIKGDSGDSIVKGYWKNDLYFGAYLHAYEILNKSVEISKVDVRNEVGLPNTIKIVSKNMIKTNHLLENNAPPVPAINYFTVSEGVYERDDRSATDKESTLILYGVKFPIHLYVNYASKSFEIIINKAGTWNLNVEFSL